MVHDAQRIADARKTDARRLGESTQPHSFPAELTMRADYDSAANAMSILIREGSHADTGDDVHARAIVALADGKPVEVQLLYHDLGIGEPLAAVADRYDLEREALQAAAQSALAAPGRVVVVEVAARASA